MLKFLSIAVIGASLAAQSPLTTTFASNNGQSGNMFDIVATNAAGITVKSFDVNIDAGSWDLEVWTLPSGTPYLPDVNNAAAWTMVGSVAGVVSNGLNVATPLPICVNTFVPAATTQAFYVTVTNGTSMNYTNGTTTGALYTSNADLEFYEGSGLAYPFNANFNPRVWNGNINYEVGDTSAVSCGFGSNVSYGVGCGGSATTLDLELVGASLPSIGNNWNLTTNNIDPVSPIAITFLGASGVAIPLVAIGLNAPGCDLNLSTLLGSIQGTAVGGSATVSLALPANAALIGQQLSGQSIALTLSNSANIVSSNGVTGTIGN